MRIGYSVVVFLLFSFGCGSNPSKKLTLLLDWWPNPNHVPIYVGIEEKIFLKHGIDIQLLKMSESTETIVYLQSKRADIALYYMPHVIRASKKISNLRMLAPYVKHPLNVFLFKKDSGILSKRDFKGKRLGGFADGLMFAYVDALMENMNISFSEIRRLQFDMTPALLNNSVDVITGVYDAIEGEQIRALGIDVKSISITEFGIPRYQELVFISRNDVLENNPTLASNFQNALQESILYCRENPNTAFDTYIRMNPNKDAKTIAWERSAWEKVQKEFCETQNFENDCWETFARWMEEHGLIGEKTDLSDLLEWGAN